MLQTSPTTSLAMAHYAASRDATGAGLGDDSSGYFGTEYDSVPTDPNHMRAYSSGSAGEF